MSIKETATYTVREANENDWAERRALWSSVFGDSESDLEIFNGKLGKLCDCLVAESEGRIISAAYAIYGVRAEGVECAYIYAVATHPDSRGMGAAGDLCKRLRDRAFGRDVGIVATLPATQSLCTWYEKLLKMSPCFVRGTEGVEFLAEWEEYAKLLAPGSEEVPKMLRATAAEGVDLEKYKDMGWKHCFN